MHKYITSFLDLCVAIAVAKLVTHTCVSREEVHNCVGLLATWSKGMLMRKELNCYITFQVLRLFG